MNQSKLLEIPGAKSRLHREPEQENQHEDHPEADEVGNGRRTRDIQAERGDEVAEETARACVARHQGAKPSGDDHGDHDRQECHGSR